MPARGRSTKVQVIAILNLVGGGLGLIVSLVVGIGLVVQRMNRTPGAPGGAITPGVAIDGAQLQDYLARNVPGLDVFQFGEFALDLLFNVMLITSGLGLLWYQKWARNVSLIWAGLSLFKKVVAIGYHLFAVLPVLNKYLTVALSNLPPGQADPMRIGGMIGGSSGVCFFDVVLMAYPIVVLCMLLSASAAKAFEEVEDDGDHPSRDEDAPRRGRSVEREPRREPNRFRKRDEEDRY